MDLNFPEELHDKFKEFPPTPETLKPDIDWLRPYQKDIGVNAGIINNEVAHGTNKLVQHLFDHTNKVIHYKNLIYLVELGVQVKQKHRVISFRQEPWLKPYIDFNNNKRQDAKNEFEKALLNS